MTMRHGIFVLVVICLARALFAETTKNPRLGFPLPPAQEIARINGLPSAALALSLSPDGKTLYAGHENGVITVWDVANKTKLCELRGESDRISVLTLSPNGEYLVSGASNGTATLWENKNGTARKTLKLQGGVVSAAFSDDNTRVLVAGRSSPIKMMAVSGEEIAPQLQEPEATRGYDAVAFLDGEHGIAARDSRWIVAWELKTGRILSVFQIPFLGHGEISLKIDPSGQWLVTGAGEFAIALFPMEEIRSAISSGRMEEKHSAKMQLFNKLQSRALRKMPVADWPMHPGKSGRVDIRGTFANSFLRSEPMEIISSDVSADGQTAAVSYWDKTIRIWGASKLERADLWRVAPDHVSTLAATPDGEFRFSADANLLVNVWNAATGEVQLSRQMQRSGFWFARPGALVADKGEFFGLATSETVTQPTGSESTNSNSLELVNLRTGERSKERNVAGRIWCAQQDRSGAFVLVGFVSPGYRLSPDAAQNHSFGREPERISALQIFDRDLNQIGSGFAAHLQNGVRAAVFSPKSSFVASIDENGAARVFDFKTRRQVSPENLPVAQATDLAVTDQGVLIAVSAVGSIRSFNAATGAQLAAVDLAHAKPIRRVALSPNGRLAATLAEDNLTRLWSVPDLKPVGGFDGPKADEHMGSIFFPNDETLVAAGIEGLVWQWPVKDAIDLARWNVHASAEAADAIAISDDGTRVAVGAETGVVYLIDAATNKEIAAVPAHSGGVREMQFSERSHTLITGGKDGLTKAWGADTSLNPAPFNSVNWKPRLETPPVEKRIEFRQDVIYIDRGRKEEICVPLNNIAVSRYLAERNQLVLAAPSGIWLLDLESKSLVWGYDVPSPVLNLTVDKLRDGLVSTHRDGVVRRWKLPPQSRTR